MIVRTLEATDRAAWEPLWAAYCAFYETTLPDATTDATFARLCDTGTPMYGTLAVDAATGVALGFAHHVVHPFTWSPQAACYLEDLFVTPAARRRGAGRALIADLIARAGDAGWGRLYWMTREHNAVARRLYDSLAQRDDFVRYALAFGDAPRD
ncbi:MAG: GNAT family N-acetyltransferase [Vulcanimicrobiaceae bacterium]